MQEVQRGQFMSGAGSHRRCVLGWARGSSGHREQLSANRKVISSLVSLNNFLVPETSDTFLKELHMAL